MFTVVRNFFKVDTIPWQGWVYSVLTGAGTLPVAFAIKFIARCQTPPSSSQKRPASLKSPWFSGK